MTCSTYYWKRPLVLGLSFACLFFLSAEVSKSEKLLPSIDLTGEEFAAPLEKLTGKSASFQIELKTRSEVFLSLVFPVVWKDAGAACGKKHEDPLAPCAEFVNIVLRDAGMPDSANIFDYPDPSRVYLPDTLQFDRSALRGEARFTLEEGKYNFHLIASQNHWPRTPLADSLVNEPPLIKVQAIRPTSVPDSLKGLDEWLREIGLSTKLQALHIYSRDGRLGKDLPEETKKRYENMLLYVAIVRTKLPGDEGSPQAREERYWEAQKLLYKKVDANPTVPSWLNQEQIPRYAIRMRAKLSRDDLNIIEKQFMETAGLPLWQRVLQKISLTENILTKDIVIDMPVWCSGGLIYEFEPGSVGRTGLECLMASSKIEMPNILTSRLGRAEEKTLNFREIDLSKEVKAFLPNFILDPNAHFDYQETTSSYVEVLVRGIRGQVINGGRDWEKLQIVFHLNSLGRASSTMRVFVDGQIASGIGAYPPDAQFTRSMEPTHSENLTQYAKKLTDQFKDRLARAH